jgi:hypothetical protein
VVSIIIIEKDRFTTTVSQHDMVETTGDTTAIKGQLNVGYRCNQ